MTEPKRLSHEAIPAALEKALRYRMLNEPAEAESICHDVLQIDPENQQALVVLLLALTDRFGKGSRSASCRPRKYCPVSAMCMSGPTTPASSANAEPRRSCVRAIPAPAMTPMSCCLTR
jgi:hypothetical protein